MVLDKPLTGNHSSSCGLKYFPAPEGLLHDSAGRVEELDEEMPKTSLQNDSQLANHEIRTIRTRNTETANKQLAPRDGEKNDGPALTDYEALEILQFRRIHITFLSQRLHQEGSEELESAPQRVSRDNAIAGPHIVPKGPGRDHYFAQA